MGCSSGVVIAPSASTLAPLIRGEPDMVGLLLGSREPLYLSSRISRTLVSCSSLSELSLPGESISYQIQGECVGCGVTSFYRLARRGGFSEGLGTSRRRRVIQGPTRQVGRLQVQGRDTPRRCRLTGLDTPRLCRLPGYNALSAAIRRQVFTFADSIRSYSVD
jgi:hypothetical protein